MVFCFIYKKISPIYIISFPFNIRNIIFIGTNKEYE